MTSHYSVIFAKMGEIGYSDIDQGLLGLAEKEFGDLEKAKINPEQLLTLQIIGEAFCPEEYKWKKEKNMLFDFHRRIVSIPSDYEYTWVQGYEKAENISCDIKTEVMHGYYFVINGKRNFYNPSSFKSFGEPGGYGMRAQIWNNHLDFVGKETCEGLMAPLKETIDKYPCIKILEEISA